jgi:hypothetical protein
MCKIWSAESLRRESLARGLALTNAPGPGMGGADNEQFIERSNFPHFLSTKSLRAIRNMQYQKAVDGRRKYVEKLRKDITV